MIRRAGAILVCIMMWSSVYGESSISIEMGYGYYVEHFSEVEKTTGDIEPIFIFPPIPGGIYGIPEEPVLYSTEAEDNRRLVVELPKNVDERARPFAMEGLSVSPGGAKLLRLGTFHVDPGNPEIMGGGAFVNVESNNYMILLYVSQPTTIKGELVFRKESFIHDLHFAGPGWHWIEVVKLKDDRYRLEAYHGEQKNIEFAVLVREGEAI